MCDEQQITITRKKGVKHFDDRTQPRERQRATAVFARERKSSPSRGGRIKKKNELLNELKEN